ncbi:MAG: hypothetical protein GYB64_02175 [Chloroflexi bacterium]|nr:hypothetical protein [Chloroflexota bacterium]
MRHLALTGVLIALTACSTPAPTSIPPATVEAQPTGEAPSQPTPQTDDDAMAEMFTDLPTPGRLAVLGADGNVYVLGSGQAPLALTDDARFEDGGTSERVYVHPTWSPTGWLSYVSVDVAEGVDVIAARPGAGTPPVTLLNSDSGYIYGYWSPAVCDGGPDCGRFAFLMGDEGQIGFYLSEMTSGSPEPTSTERLRLSGSHYYVWSADGESMLWYRNSTAMSVYDVAGDAIVREIDESFGLFQTPDWASGADRLLFTRQVDGENQLVLREGDAQSELSGAFPGLAAFSLSPETRWAAYASGPANSIPYAGLTLTRTDGSQTFSVDALDHILAFFWSPDGSKLALVNIEEAQPNFEANGRLKSLSSRTQQQGQSVLVWYVVDVETQELTRLEEFLPTGDQLYVLQFFDQYAKSHQIWSPDSRYIVYAEELADEDRSVIHLLDTQNPGQNPLRIGEGRFAVFSFVGN